MIFSKSIVNIYKKQMFKRCDETGLVKYFTHEDFPFLEKHPYNFKSSLNHQLSGAFYSYPNYQKDTLVIFDHGFGGGHLSYMKEIEKLCHMGYLVFTYDHTGCMKSEGDSPRGFSQSLRDLDDAINTLLNDPNISIKNLYVAGHSWGGYATLNICKYHKEIQKIVVLSGFVSVKKIIEQNFKGLLKGYQKDIFELEANTNPDYIDNDAVLNLKNSETKALLIYSDNDHLVDKKIHYDYLYENLKDNKNIKFLLEHNKGHNPNYTLNAVSLLKDLTIKTKKAKNLNEEEKIKFRDSFDFDKMTEQDEDVWKEIEDFLKGRN